MKKRILHSSFATLLFIGLFLFGFQHNAEAQLRVFNNTGCPINLAVYQNVACNDCNASAIIAVPNGGFYVHPASPLCGPENWLAVRYYLNSVVSPGPVSSFGITYNPMNGCGYTDTNGLCNSNVISGSWFGFTATGVGPQTVILN